MSPSPTATLEQDGERFALRFERSLSHPPEEVWAALVDAGRLHEWHPTPFELGPSPRAGGSVRFIAEAAPVEVGDGQLLEFEPPRRLAYTWFEDELSFELEPQGQGCLLVLRHTFSDRFKAARDAAGWDLCLDRLDASLAGAPVARETGALAPPDGWQELNAEYQRRFGIPAELATPPPSR